jgi:hypothetical protein
MPPHPGHHAFADEHPAGLHAHVRDGVAHVHDTRADALIFWGLLLGVVAIQALIYFWKRRSPKTFGLVTLLALWTFPLISALLQFSIRFVSVWLLYSAATAYFVRLATRKPLLPKTPRAGMLTTV